MIHDGTDLARGNATRRLLSAQDDLRWIEQSGRALGEVEAIARAVWG
jgi:hypothetical protein